MGFAMSTYFFPDAELALECVEPGLIERKIRACGGSLMMVEVVFCCRRRRRAAQSPAREQVTYCLSGVFEFTIAGETRLVRAGDSLYVPGGAEHGTRCLEGGHLLDVFTPQREDFSRTPRRTHETRNPLRARPEDVKGYDTEALRRHFLVEQVFAIGEINLVYSMSTTSSSAAVQCPPSKRSNSRGRQGLWW